MVHNDVIVVGAGMAGLGAARMLHDAGLDVLVCEAQPRIGGRVQSLRTQTGQTIELGAEFIHGDTVSTWQLVRQLNLATSVDARWHGRIVWDWRTKAQKSALRRGSTCTDTLAWPDIWQMCVCHIVRPPRQPTKVSMPCAVICA